MQALITQVLAAWREAERVASHTHPSTAQHRAAVAAVERLRALYLDLMDAVKAAPPGHFPPTLPPELEEGS